MGKKGLFILLIAVLLTSCGEYQRLLKSHDPEEKYQAALMYFNNKQYIRAQTLLDDVSSYYRGTERSEDVLAYTVFVELYPESPYAEQAYKEMSEMYDKLAYKELLNAKLYYNLGSYLGNNYLSCEIVCKNALKNFPSNKYQEDFSWLILQSKYQEMVNSFEEKLPERARDAQDEYYNFVTEFPNSKHRKEADKMQDKIRKTIRE